MMDTIKYRNFLLTNLNNPKEASGGKEIQCRCYNCDDHSRHMYISIPQNDDEPSLYNCFRCGTKGIVTDTKLMEWNVYDDEIALMLINHNKHLKRGLNFGSHDVMRVFNPLVTDEKSVAQKLQYINNRLGTNLTAQEWSKLKVVFSLNEFLAYNHIINLTRNPNIVNELDKYFIGFLSFDNAFLNMRKIVKDGICYKGIDKRYVNYNICNKYDNSERFYTIPSTINMNSPERIKLHIAEGPMDILSIYLNLRNREPGIYTSIAGCNYVGILMHFIVTLKLNWIELHFYPDKGNGGEEYKLKEIKNICNTMGIPLYFHINNMDGEKDMGVPKERIKEIIYNGARF